MPTYSYTRVLHSEDTAVVKNYTNGTSRNYIKTSDSIKKIVWIKYQDKKLDSTEYKLYELSTDIGLAITFGDPSILEGSIDILYYHENDTQPREEILPIIQYKQISPGVEANINNYIEVTKYPIIEPSISYPVKITDQNNVEITYTDEVDITVGGDGREKVFVGEMEIQAVSIEYYYAEGQLAILYQQKLDYTEEINEIEDYLDEVTTEYQDTIDSTKPDKEIAEKNLSLAYKKLILTEYPDLTTYDSEASSAASLESLWDTNKDDPDYWDPTPYDNFKTTIETFRDLLNTNGQLDIFSNDKNCAKVFTYAAKLGVLNIEETTVTVDSGNSQTYDLGGNNTGTTGDLSKLIDGTQNAYVESNPFSLRFCINENIFMTAFKIEAVPLAATFTTQDNIKVHVSADKTSIPADYRDITNDLGLMADNKSLLNIIDDNFYKYEFTTFVQYEPLKDSSGSPIELDSNDNPFNHYILPERNTTIIVKDSVQSTNYITEITYSIPIADILLFLNSTIDERGIARDACQDFIDKWNNGSEKINAWRSSSSNGVSYLNGSLGVKDDITYFDSTSPDGGNRDLAWDFVKADIQAIIDLIEFNTEPRSRLSSWKTETDSEGITEAIANEKINIWSSKYESAINAYRAALNGKFTRIKEQTQKQAILDDYGSLPTPT